MPKIAHCVQCGQGWVPGVTRDKVKNEGEKAGGNEKDTAHDIKTYIPTHLKRDLCNSEVIVAGGNSASIDTIAENMITAKQVISHILSRGTKK